ncbi:MAG: response regulator transcription factor [Armatimonadota bacterium]
MYRALIITDDWRLADTLASSLAGSNVITANTGTSLDALDIALSKGGPDIVVVDLRLVESSDRLIETVREQPGIEDAPIIGILPESALSSLPLPPLDDFVLEPVSLPELTARILTRLIKNGTSDDGNVVKAGKLEVDVDNYKARIGNDTLDLTYTEFELLRFLVTHKGRVFTREALLNRVWGYDYYGGARTVDVHIRRLRSKLGPHQSLIETVRNVGYRFSE